MLVTKLEKSMAVALLVKQSKHCNECWYEYFNTIVIMLLL